MMVSPFTFYRRAAKIMAADLKETPRAGLNAQLCGDAHLSNFGLFASPERELLFDLNDFDETLPGPFAYDVQRMSASFTIAARVVGRWGVLKTSLTTRFPAFGVDLPQVERGTSHSTWVRPPHRRLGRQWTWVDIATPACE
jgi:hypothetical protein